MTCSAEDCLRESYTLGLCDMHYQRAKRFGDPNYDKLPDVFCSVEDCLNKPLGRGLCSKHYQRWTKSGDPLVTKIVTPEMSLSDRLEKYSDRNGGPDACWIWVGTLDKDGYGMLDYQTQSWRAHRAAWTLAFGEIPKGLFVCHHCDIPSCCNPKHLFLGTNDDNMVDMVTKGRAAVMSGSTNGQAKLTEEQVIEIRELWKGGQLRQIDIADMYGVARAHISGIVHRKFWKHL